MTVKKLVLLMHCLWIHKQKHTLKFYGRTEDRETLQKIKDEKQKADNAIVEDFEVSGEALPGTGGKNLNVAGRVPGCCREK